MPLIKTIAEVRDLHPRLISGTSKDHWLPNFQQAEEKYLVPIVGRPLYLDILAKYDAGTLVDLDVDLQKLMAAVVVAAAYLDEAPRNVAKITDNGIRSANTSDMQRIFGWEFREFKQGLTALYHDTIDNLLRWLYDNANAFPLYEESDEYKAYQALLIKNGADFHAQYRLHQPMRTFWQLRPLLQEAQNTFIRMAIGKDLLAHLLFLESPSEDIQEIQAALRKALAYYTIYRACRVYTVRFGDTGFTITTGDVEAQSTTQGTSGTTMFDHHMRASLEEATQYLGQAVRLCQQLRASEAAEGTYIDAYDLGPLKTYVTPTAESRNQNMQRGLRLGI